MCTVMLLFVIVAVVNPQTVKADTNWPDGNGNGIPDGIETSLVNACNAYGQHTYWTMWMNPYNITPPDAATSYNVGLYGVAYVCPGVSYSSISQANIFGLSAPNPPVGLTAGNIFLGSAARGSFTPVGGITVVLNLTAIPRNTCQSYSVGFGVEALHGGSYDSDSGLSQAVTVCYFPQAPLPPPDVNACEAITAPSPVNPGQTFTASLRIHNGSGHTWTRATSSGGSTGHKLGSSGPLIADRGQRNNTKWGISRVLLPSSPASGSDITIVFTATAPTTLGLHTFAWEIVDENVHWEDDLGKGYTYCTRVIRVDPPPPPPRFPYLSIFGGDSHAGAVLSNTIDSSGCSSLNSSSRIRGQRVDGDSGSRGQYGLGATSNLEQFGSAGDVNGNAATFGNTPSDGNFYRTVCRPDFSKLATTTTLREVNGGTNPTSYNLANLPVSANGQVIFWEPKAPGGIPKTLTGSVPAGRRVTIVSPDSVLITGNIRYLGTDAPTYTSVDQIPALMLVSGSDIMVASTVQSITGYYVANRAISTCTDLGTSLFGSPVFVSIFYPTITSSGGGQACGSRLLRIYGAIAAQNVYWRRTGGDVTNSDGSFGSDSTHGAELVLMIPELYLSTPPGLSSQSGLRSFIGDLPPVF